jgi:DMSO reductase family type II enzyme chaperone
MIPQLQPEQIGEVLRTEAALWRFLHHLMRSPDDKQWDWLQQAETGEAWALLAGLFPGSSVSSTIPRPASLKRYQEEYLHLFEVGAPAPPFPLLEHHWVKSRPPSKILSENARFYSHFGLRIAPGARETVDHLRYQLEFLAWVCEMGARLADEGRLEQALQADRARGDFLGKHLLTWIPKLVHAVGQIPEPSWPFAWLGLVLRAAELGR